MPASEDSVGPEPPDVVSTTALPPALSSSLAGAVSLSSIVDSRSGRSSTGEGASAHKRILSVEGSFLQPRSTRAACSRSAGRAESRAASHGRTLVASAVAAVAPSTPNLGSASWDSLPGECQKPRTRPDDEITRLSEEVAQLQRDLEHQAGQRKVIQTSLASERARNEVLAQQNLELTVATEERLRGLERVAHVEASELESQVDALIRVKRQLYQRVQDLESERSTLLQQREELGRERSCVACLDRLANTVLLQCRHLVCCERCASKLRQCPMCREPVRDRLTVFMV